MTQPRQALFWVALMGLVFAILIVQPVDHAAAQPAEPEAPRVFIDTTPVPPSGQTVLVRAGANLQAALNAAQPGDILLLEAGATFLGPFTLPEKTGAGWVTIRTSVPDGTFPPPGTRVNPSHASLMPRIIGTGAPVIAIRTAPRAHHYRLIGIELRPEPGRFATSLVRLGTGSEMSPADFPHDIIFDRVWIHGDPVVGARRGIALNSGPAAVIDSYLSDFKEIGADSQALAGWSGPGPFKIVNNYLEAAGENVMFGGADPSLPRIVPSDIEIRLNHFAKPLAWRVGDPGHAGVPWTIKNIFEIKNARRVLVEHNLFEHNWGHAQDGTAINIKSSGGAVWSVAEDVLFQHNVVRHAGGGIKISYDQGLQPPTRIAVRNNLWLDLDGKRWSGRGWFALVMGGRDLIFDHNTAFATESILLFDGPSVQRLGITNNILTGETLGIKGSGTAPGEGTLSAYAPGAVVRGNVMVGVPAETYPKGNWYPASLVAVAFVAPASGDYRLKPSSTYSRAGIGGADIGVNVDKLVPVLTVGMKRPGAEQGHN